MLRHLSIYLGVSLAAFLTVGIVARQIYQTDRQATISYIVPR